MGRDPNRAPGTGGPAELGQAGRRDGRPRAASPWPAGWPIKPALLPNKQTATMCCGSASAPPTRQPSAHPPELLPRRRPTEELLARSQQNCKGIPTWGVHTLRGHPAWGVHTGLRAQSGWGIHIGCRSRFGSECLHWLQRLSCMKFFDSWFPGLFPSEARS